MPIVQYFFKFFFIRRVDLRAGNNVVKFINLHIGRVPLTTYWLKKSDDE